MQYLAMHRVTGYRETHTPLSYRGRADGYGSRIPCRAWLELDGKRWHRVYCVCWGNGGTLFVHADGGKLWLATGALEAVIRRCGLTECAKPLTTPITTVLSPSLGAS